MTIRYLSAGESHGPSLTAILEGFWSNVPIDLGKINHELKRRQMGYGRGGRMKIERDSVQVLSGIRHGYTTGSPITLQILNRDYENWKQVMSAEIVEGVEESEARQVTKPRPGHADLNGSLKYQQNDVRNILERSSARETAIRTAVGSLCKQLLSQFDITIQSYVTGIGSVMMSAEQKRSIASSFATSERDELANDIESSLTKCPDAQLTEQMIEEIDKFWNAGDTVGGEFEIMAVNVPVGLGSHVHYDRKLDADIASALMSLQGIKGVEIGAGFQVATLPGSQIHDEISYNTETGYYRLSNNAGGIEGGMSNGEPIVVRAAMKPIPTLMKPLNSVDMYSKEPYVAQVERSDACAVPAASVVAENILAYELVRHLKEKFGGDSLAELSKNYY